MKLYNKHKQVNLIVEDSLLKNLMKEAIKNYPNECGGFLIGYYSKDNLTLYLTDTIMPIKDKKSKFLFERSIEGVGNKLIDIFKIKKEYYIGEWHTHPNSSTMYSETDLNAMIKIAEHNTVNIKNPILLILSSDNKKLKDFTFYIYDNKKLYNYG